jgi:hypothetical protein
MFLAHHCFLPPKLPQQDDSDPKLDQLMLTTIEGTLEEFGDLVPSHSETAAQARQAIAGLRVVLGPSGQVDEANLLEGLQSVTRAHGEFILSCFESMSLDHGHEPRPLP